MTTRTGWLLPRSGAGGQSREDTRLAPIGAMVPTGNLTTRTGVIPTPTPYAVSGTGMTVTVGPGRGVAQGTTTQGAIPSVTTAAESIVLPDGNGVNPRIDLIGVRVYENFYDALGQTLAKIDRVAGTPASIPAPPAAPSAFIPICEVRVEANSSAGVPINWGTAVTDRKWFTVAVGGIQPGPDTTNGVYVGQYRDTGTGLQRWSGAAWVSLFPALTSVYAQSTTTVISSSTSYVDTATVLSTTVVVPPSGKVDIAGVLTHYSNSSGYGYSDLLITGSTSGTLRTPTDVQAMRLSGPGPDVTASYSFVQSGTAGETLTVKWQHRVTTGAIQLSFRAIKAVPLAG